MFGSMDRKIGAKKTWKKISISRPILVPIFSPIFQLIALKILKDVHLIAVNSFSFFRPLYISVIEEPDNRETEDKHIKSLVDTYQRTGENKCGSSAEVYEQNFLESIYRNDRKNYEFFKRLSICPNQVIRYQWMGMPLVNSDNHRLEVSKCQLCGADRTFEFQLMPALITYLKPLANSGIISDLDFGTVLVFTCARNCKPSNDSFASEQIIVLSDPDNEIVDKIKIK